MASRKNVQNLQVAGIGVAAVLVLVLLGFLIWPLIRDLRNVSEAAGQVANDVSDAVTATTGAASQTVQTVANATGGVFDPSQGNQAANDSKDAPTPGKRNMKLHWARRVNDNSGGKKRNEVLFTVLDEATGQPVRGARVVGRPHWSLTRQALGDPIMTDYTDARGRVGADWWVFNAPLRDNEDTITWFARKPGYNDSNSVTTR